ncbi:MAG: hypothetical protein ABIS21_03765 [Acidimicrobiales bacterium]
MLQLRPDADTGNGGPPTFGAWSDDRRVATLLIRVDTLASALQVTVADPVLCTLEQSGELLRAVVAHARTIPVPHVEIATVDPLLRDDARRTGFECHLRRPLRCRADEPASASRPADARDMADIVASLVGVRVTVVPAPRWISRMARGAVAGFAAMVRYNVDPQDGRPALAVTVPDRADAIPESVALTVDVALSVRRRFGAAIDHLQTLSFDHSSHGLKGGQLAGEAHANASIISLNASYVLAAYLEEDRRHSPSVSAAGDRALLPPPFTSLERTTAHELWHQIEATFEARRYRESIEFRRQLGDHLGVETLEHAIRGRHADAPPPWRAAQGRLVEEVSDYGGTLPGEATAEMFKDWWCPVTDLSPTVARFGELVDRYFPASR